MCEIHVSYKSCSPTFLALMKLICFCMHYAHLVEDVIILQGFDWNKLVVKLAYKLTILSLFGYFFFVNIFHLKWAWTSKNQTYLDNKSTLVKMTSHQPNIKGLKLDFWGRGNPSWLNQLPKLMQRYPFPKITKATTFTCWWNSIYVRALIVHGLKKRNNIMLVQLQALSGTRCLVSQDHLILRLMTLQDNPFQDGGFTRPPPSQASGRNILSNFVG